MPDSSPTTEGAARELDALIAERNGWTCVHFMGPPDDWYGRPPGRSDTNYRVPHYSANLINGGLDIVPVQSHERRREG
jgi:hypothetical protein